jgi:5-methylcytosine-specific restriction endonuclease McrA
MGMIRKKTVGPDPTWAVPAPSWTQALDRYTKFLQVPTWRAGVKRGGQEKAACLSPTEAVLLRDQMLTALGRVSSGRLLVAKPSSRDLKELWRRRGRNTPRSERCPSKLQVHFQRAFLLNTGGYTCAYCHRTAWGVFAEKCEAELPRTLRFEVDHHTTRGRLADPEVFDPKNLVAACRSCNVIKGEMSVQRFLAELDSLGSALQHWRRQATATV